MQKITVSALEYAALCDVDKMVRVCLVSPAAGEMLVGAIKALDMVREDEGIKTEEVKPLAPKLAPVSALASALIERAKRQ
jgi:hypothetical protein